VTRIYLRRPSAALRAQQSWGVRGRAPRFATDRSVSLVVGQAHPLYGAAMDVIDAIGNTPLIQLKRVAAGLPVPVFIKCEHLNPGGSIKDRTARAIVLDAEDRGQLRPGATLIEGTAGNTGVGLALLAAARGYRLICVLPERMAIDKRVALRQLGAEVIITNNGPLTAPHNFRNVANRMAEDNGWFLTNQFHNPANLGAHYGTPRYKGTAQEILAQVQAAGFPTLGAFVMSSGTGGTISGSGRRLKEHDQAIQIVLADPIGSSIADWVTTGTLGPDGPYAVEGIGSGSVPGNLHREVLDSAEKVADAEAFAMVERLAKEESLTVGGSTGVNVVAALRVAARGGLGGPVVTVACDQWDRYRSTAWMKAWTDREAALIERAPA
jgi:cysteine synthase